MPLHHYCSCGAKIAYETVKPAKCPKCGKPLRDAVAILHKAIQAAPSVSEVPYDDGDMDEGLTPEIVDGTQATAGYRDEFIVPPARSERSQPVKRKVRQKPRFEQQQAIQIDGDDDEFGAEETAGGYEGYDPDRVKRLARQMAASFDPNGVHVVSEASGDRMTFGQLASQRNQDHG